MQTIKSDPNRKRGTNRANPFEELSRSIKDAVDEALVGPLVPSACVFISHKREDTDDCEQIAEYLLAAGVDVYFDKYDKTLSELVDEGNPNKVTERIQLGIDKSSHMLCVVSRDTVSSYWVPFEVGYGYGKIALGVLTLKGVEEREVPDYMRTTDVIRGTLSLNELIAKLLRASRSVLEAKGAIKPHTMRGHALDGVLDWRR